MFEDTIALFDHYYRTQDAANTRGINRDLECEVRERLQQLNYIVIRVRELESIATKAISRPLAAFKEHVENLKHDSVPFESAPAPSAVMATQGEVMTIENAKFEMKLLTEAFYYFAGRVRTILQNPTAPLPGLKSFECKGVGNVRNKLLEHAENKDSQVWIQSFGWGAAHGPVLKAARYGGQENIFSDRGLYANAEEFRDNLERLLHVELSKT